MLWRLRFLGGALAVVLYVGVAALRVAAEPTRAWLGLALGLLILLAGWRATEPPARVPNCS